VEEGFGAGFVGYREHGGVRAAVGVGEGHVGGRGGFGSEWTSGFALLAGRVGSVPRSCCGVRREERGREGNRWKIVREVVGGKGKRGDGESSDFGDVSLESWIEGLIRHLAGEVWER
jgi:hypothetical protein